MCGGQRVTLPALDTPYLNLPFEFYTNFILYVKEIASDDLRGYKHSMQAGKDVNQIAKNEIDELLDTARKEGPELKKYFF